ncbi:MAG: MarR family transcriptional regulator [Saprospiraceae bacterium]|nr:MarR family transcriptional regulator [Saprospiraceae bacterium]
MKKYHIELQVKIYRASQLMLRREQDFFKEFEITQKQFNILRILRGIYPNSLSLKEIGERMIDPSSDVTRLTNRLIKKELIETSPNKHDKRFKDASLTKAGLTLLAKIDKIAVVQMKTGIENLSEAECSTLSALLDKIAKDDLLTNNVIVK